MTATSPNTVGVDVAATHDLPQFDLGKEVMRGGTKYVYVSAAAAKTQYSLYYIGTDFALGNGVAGATVSASGSPAKIGVPQVAFATPSTGYTYRYGWVAVKGSLTVSAAAASTANVKVYTTTTAGQLSATSSSQSVLQGLFITSQPGVAACMAAFAVTDLYVN
jgi:hypothetical protein